MGVNPGRQEKWREGVSTALSCGHGEDCYEYHGLREELTNQI